MKKDLSALRTLVETLGGSALREYWTAPGLATGLPRGAITQICGAGKTEFVARFLKAHRELKVAWIETPFSIYPSGLFQREVELDRILFIDPGEEFPWALQQVMKSGLFEVVILASPAQDLKMLRQFQLSAEKAHAALVLLSESLSGGWPVALQLQSSRNQGGRIQVDVIRKR